MRMENKEAARLGVPLPSGQVAVFAPHGDESLLVGEGSVRDHAVGEKVDLVIGESSQVRVDIVKGGAPKMADDDYRVTVTNANPFAVDFELGFYVDPDPKLDKRLRKLPRRDGLLTWAIRVPANGIRSFDYRFAEPTVQSTRPLKAYASLVRKLHKKAPATQPLSHWHRAQ